MADVSGKGHIDAGKERFSVGMLSLIIGFSLQEAGCVKAEINKGLWQLSCNSSATCPVKKNSSLQLIYVMFMAH